ncbi:hypothetical protein [Microbispora sp. KK1-11]|nr:hypothetical protein [Microbispora sp. KK1-11]
MARRLSVDLGPPLQRAALCVLAAKMGQVATKDALISRLTRAEG